MYVYITDQGAVISRRRGRIVISKYGQILSSIPEKKITKLCLMGNISLTTHAIHFFLDYGIDVIFMTQFGRYRGKLYKEEYRNVLLRLGQYEKAKDELFQLKMAKSIVAGKLKNYQDYLFWKRKNTTKGALSQEIASIRSIIEKIDNAKDINNVRGLEGIGTKFYFSGLKKLIKNPDFVFTKRIAHPPKDRINSLLSFGYSMLYNEVLAAMNNVGLDPYFGNLHTVEISKKSLLFDMVEEYRCLVIDDFIIKLVNRNEVNKDDFEEVEKDVYHFTHSAMKKFLSKYERVLSEKRKYHLDDENNFIRIIFEKQARQYARVILGDAQHYIPYKKI